MAKGKMVLRCTQTGTTYDAHEPRWCGENGTLLDLLFSPHLEVAALTSRKPNLWRYRECLPIERDDCIVSFAEGFTPLLAVQIYRRRIWIKQEHLFQTGSFKDRGATVLISKVRELGIDRVVQDSSGNAGCSIAAYCAAAGIGCTILVPQSTAPAKVAQIRAYGADVRLIPGDRQATAAAALEMAATSYYASHCWNPFFLHGTKTFAYEVWEQLGFQPPDVLVLPVGNGTLVLGAFIGFTDLLNQGLIDRLPQIVAVQALNCSPLFHAFTTLQQRPAAVTVAETMAEGIAIAAPIRGGQILSAVRATHGRMLAVTEEEIWQAQHAMAHQGFYIEPTAAAGIAGAMQLSEEIEEGKILVAAFTGHGLKHGFNH